MASTNYYNMGGLYPLKGEAMEFSTEFWVQILVLIGGIAAIWGAQKQTILHIRETVDRLEKKQDKHNNLIERMAINERDIKSAHFRLDKVEKKL